MGVESNAVAGRGFDRTGFERNGVDRIPDEERTSTP